MDVNVVTHQPELVRPELGSLLAIVSMLIDNQRSVVLHLTSTQHREGTTTIARELVAAAARSPWCRVALVDAGPPEPDLPLPASLIDSFERMEEPVLWRARLNAAEVAIGHLSGYGRMTPRVETVRGLYAWLRSQFTLIIVDSPPVLVSRDTAVFASIADGTILVVEAERTKRSDIDRARTILDSLGASMIGVVLNKRQTRLPRLMERLI